jgi:DNA gyrase/topoisomerase IV subunit B
VNLTSCPPEPGLLIALAAQRLRWITVFGEWLDNCLDANANHIEIVIEKDHLSVRDNGRAVPI